MTAGSPDGGTGGDANEGDENGDDEWRFSLEDVGPGGKRSTSASDSESETGPTASEPIEAESPDRENVVFFVLGVCFALGVLASLFL